MSTSSTVSTVKAQLVSLIAAALPTVQVSRSQPPVAELEREAIWIDPRLSGRHEIATIRAGRKHRAESYTLNVIVSVLDQDDGADVAEDRAMTLLAEVEDLLADDPKLGLATTIDWAAAGAFEVLSVASSEPQGWLVEVKFGIDVMARLT